MEDLESGCVVIKVTGSLFDGVPRDTAEISSVASVIRKFMKKGRGSIGVVVGGGAVSRTYVEAIRALGGSEEVQDSVGIIATRLNAAVMIAALRGAAYPRVLTRIEEFRTLSRVEKILVGGGFHPAFSTAACAALVAEAIGARLLVVMSRSGGVYDRDPERCPEAKLLREVSVKELMKLILNSGLQRAGYYPLLDLTSINIILRSKIPTVIIPPRAEVLKMALNGKAVGTKVLV